MVMAEATIIPRPETKLKIRGRVIPFRVRDLCMEGSYPCEFGKGRASIEALPLVPKKPRR
jgi:hypothetical protein